MENESILKYEYFWYLCCKPIRNFVKKRAKIKAKVTLLFPSFVLQHFAFDAIVHEYVLRLVMANKLLN